MLAEPARTAYDLNFRIFGFPVRVHPLFWLGAVLLGANVLDAGLHFLVIWVAVVFVSILVHELGHALAFRRFGSDSQIVLWVFGGLAIPHTAVGNRWRRIAATLAGPAAGFILCGAVYASDYLTGWGAPRNGLPAAFLCASLIFVNLVWGLMNLLPVFPLDGGQVSRELCESRWRGRGLRISLQISIATASTLAAYSLFCHFGGGPGGPLAGVPWWARGSLYTAVLFTLLAVQSYFLLQQIGRSYYYEGPDDRVPWER